METPALSTFHSLVPPIWKSANSDPEPEAVFVAFINKAASTTPVVFQIGAINNAGRAWEPVNELEMYIGMAVDPAVVSTSNCLWFVLVPPVAADDSSSFKNVWLLDVWAVCHVCGLLPLDIVLDPVAAVRPDRAELPPPVAVCGFCN